MRIWVVEMWMGERFEATVGVGLTREQGRAALREWRANNPSDRFRLVAYVPARPRV